MAASGNRVPTRARHHESGPRPHWGLRLGPGAAAMVLLAIVYLVVRLFLPAWWATRIGNQTQGSITGGILLGLVYGFAFTIVLLLIARQARYKKVLWPWRSVIVLLSALVATPNLLTLSIYANNSGSAAKARTMIDTGATWFPSWSLGGGIAGLVLFAGIAAFWHLWHSRRKKLKAMKSDLNAQGSARATPATSQGQNTPMGRGPFALAYQGDAQVPSWSTEEKTGGLSKPSG